MSDSALTRPERRRALRTLYERVPRVECKGHCAQSCGPIGCSDLEREVIETRAGKPLRTVRHPTEGPQTCSMLSPTGRCTVYGDRPMVCRLWGSIPEMPCPHGCRILDPPLHQGDGALLLVDSMRLGGGKRADLQVSAELREYFERLLKDPQFVNEWREFIGRGMRADARRMGL